MAQAYEDRQLTTQQALAAFEALANQAAAAATERARMGLDANSYAIYVAFKPYLAGVIAEQAAMLNTLFQQHPDYGWDIQQQSALRAALYQALIPLVGQQQFIAATTALMKLQRVCRRHSIARMCNEHASCTISAPALALADRLRRGVG